MLTSCFWAKSSQKAVFIQVHHAGLKRQRGQAVVLVLLLSISIVLIGFSIANNAISISDKMQMQNAADAAALGVSTLEARDLNFIAYTNRAMIANETALGQLVGIASWAIMVRSIGPTLDAYLEPLLKMVELISIRLAKPMADAVRTLIKAITYTGKAVGIVVKTLAKFTSKAIRQINKAYSLAQRIYHQGTMILSMATISDMIEQNQGDSDKAHLSLFGLLALASHIDHYYKDFVKLYSQTEGRFAQRKGMERLAAVVNKTRDDFSLDRDGGWTIPTFLGLGIKNPLLDVSIDLSVNRKGGSDLRFIDPYEGRHLDDALRDELGITSATEALINKGEEELREKLNDFRFLDPYGRVIDPADRIIGDGLGFFRNYKAQRYSWSGADTASLDFSVKVRVLHTTFLDQTFASLPFGIGAAQKGKRRSSLLGFDPYKGDASQSLPRRLDKAVGILDKVPVVGRKISGISGRVSSLPGANDKKEYLQFDPGKLNSLAQNYRWWYPRIKAMIHEGFGGDVKAYGYGHSPTVSPSLWGPMPIYVTGIDLPPWVLPQGTPPEVAYALDAVAGDLGVPVPVPTVLTADAVKSPAITIRRDGRLGGYRLFQHHDTKLVEHSGHGHNPDAPYITIGLSKSGGRIAEAIGHRSTDVDDYISPESEQNSGGIFSFGRRMFNNMSVLGKAEAYFRRPVDLSYFLRKDGRLEYASGFNPFWQARLAEITERERQLALRAQQIAIAADTTAHSVSDVFEMFK